MEKIRADRTICAVLHCFRPGTEEYIDPSELRFSVWVETSLGQWAPIETGMIADSKDTVGIYRKNYWLHPSVFVSGMKVRFLATWRYDEYRYDGVDEIVEIE